MSRTSTFSSLASLVLLAGTSSLTQAEDWPFFRGPHHTGASSETNWKVWNDEPKVAWKTDVGIGASSFTVVGNHVLTSGNMEDHDVIFCLDLNTGKEKWSRRIPCKFEKRMFEGGTASTPTVADGHVYNLTYDGQLQCLRLEDGSPVWTTNLLDEYKGKLSRWKYAGSPLVHGDHLVVDVGGDGNSTLCLDRKTGEKIWGTGDDNAGYASPVPISSGGMEAILVFKGKKLVAHSAANGKELWEVKWKTSYDVNASTPVPVGTDRLLVSSGYGGGRAALFDTSKRKPKELWLNKDIKTKMSSCVVHGDHVFAVCGDSDGQLVCVGLKDGKTLWTQKGFGFGSVALAGDRLIVLGEKGNLVIAKANGESYQPLAQAQILQKSCWVNPVLANGRILCKNNKGSVVCIDVR
ncbi:MAG: PQQ-binding-like beta-propeller repeat protein [Verrucomicrobiota bacterium]